MGLFQQEWSYSMGFKKRSFPGPVRESPVGFRGRQAIPKPTAAAPARPHHPIPSQLPQSGSALHTPGKSNGYSSFLACAGGAKSEGKGKKKITTNVPPIMSHEAELLFLPCWILPFPCYFPSSGWEPRGRQDWPRLCQLPGDRQAQPRPGSHLGLQYNSPNSRFSSALLHRQKRI